MIATQNHREGIERVLQSRGWTSLPPPPREDMCRLMRADVLIPWSDVASTRCGEICRGSRWGRWRTRKLAHAKGPPGPAGVWRDGRSALGGGKSLCRHPAGSSLERLRAEPIPSRCCAPTRFRVSAATARKFLLSMLHAPFEGHSRRKLMRRCPLPTSGCAPSRGCSKRPCRLRRKSTTARRRKNCCFAAIANCSISLRMRSRDCQPVGPDGNIISANKAELGLLRI